MAASAILFGDSKNLLLLLQTLYYQYNVEMKTVILTLVSSVSYFELPDIHVILHLPVEQGTARTARRRRFFLLQPSKFSEMHSFLSLFCEGIYDFTNLKSKKIRLRRAVFFYSNRFAFVFQILCQRGGAAANADLECVRP